MAEPQADHNSTCCEPRDKVFHTTEILEGILECLPAKTLFVVQRVNKRFHGTIADSPCIQRKMFLRIDNDHSVFWEADRMNIGSWRLKLGPNVNDAPGTAVTPVVLNPCLERVRPHKSHLIRFLEGGEHLTFNCHDTFSHQQFQHMSIGKGFFSDPQGTHIKVKLCFTLGSAVTVHVYRTVNTNAPLTVDAVITHAMDAYGKVLILREGNAFGNVIKQGVPRELLNELEHQTGHEVSFPLSESKFQFLGFVAPTDEERVVANSNALEG